MPMHVIPSPAEGIYSLLTRVSFTFINGPASSRAQREGSAFTSRDHFYEPRPFLRAATRGSGLESVLSARSAYLHSGFLFARVSRAAARALPHPRHPERIEGSVFTSRDHSYEPRPEEAVLESVLSARSAHLHSGFLFACVIPSRSESVASPASSRAQRGICFLPTGSTPRTDPLPIFSLDRRASAADAKSLLQDLQRPHHHRITRHLDLIALGDSERQRHQLLLQTALDPFAVA
jgi:hypothetical protein